MLDSNDPLYKMAADLVAQSWAEKAKKTLDECEPLLQAQNYDSIIEKVTETLIEIQQVQAMDKANREAIDRYMVGYGFMLLYQLRSLSYYKRAEKNKDKRQFYLALKDADLAILNASKVEDLAPSFLRDLNYLRDEIQKARAL